MKTKKFLSILLMLTMIFSSVQTNIIFADEYTDNFVVEVDHRQFETIEEAFSFAERLSFGEEDAEIKLLQDITLANTEAEKEELIANGTLVDGQCYMLPKCSLTINLNGHNLINASGNTFGFYEETNLTLKDSVGTGTISELYCYTGTLSVYGGDKLHIQNAGDGNISFYGGKFEHICVTDAMMSTFDPIELLADGYAYFNTDETILTPNESTYSMSGDFVVAEHPSCSFGENNKCACGRYKTYSVSIVDNGEITLTSEKSNQKVKASSAMETVTYSANSDYYFPQENDSVEGLPTTSFLINAKINDITCVLGTNNGLVPAEDVLESISKFGITVKSQNHNTITISGTPTKDVTISLPKPTKKLDPLQAPSADLFTVKNISESGETNGAINGVKSTMEYKIGESGDITAIESGTTSLENLGEGTYYFRYKGEYYRNCSDWTAVSLGICEHTEFDSSSKCTQCGKQAQVLIQNGESQTYSANFETALKNASNNQTLKLCDNATISGSVTEYLLLPNSTFSIDLNGKTITSAKIIAIQNGTNLSISDSAGNGKVDGKICIGGGSKLKISGGTFSSIYNSFNSNFASQDILADGILFKDENEKIIKVTEFASNFTNVTAVPHTCRLDENGVCSECGTEKDCLITAENGDTYFGSNFKSDFENAPVGSTVKLLKNITLKSDDHDSSSSYYYLPNKKVTLDLNGKTLSLYFSDVSLNINSDLTITDSVGTGCISPQNSDSYINCNLSNGKLTVYGGKLYIANVNNNNVTFYGGTISILARTESNKFNPLNLLADGKAYFDSDGKLLKVSNSEIMELSDVNVKNHTCSPNESGECDCGRKITASITKPNGELVYNFETLTNGSFENILKNAEDGSTIKLYSGFNPDGSSYINLPSKKLTIDFNGNTTNYANTLYIFGGADYIIKDSVGTANISPLNITGGKCAVYGGNVYIEKIAKEENVTFYGGTITFTLSDSEEFNPLSLLADGKAYFDSDRNLLKLPSSVNQDSEIDLSNLTVADHTCGFDENGECNCGRYLTYTVKVIGGTGMSLSSASSTQTVKRGDSTEKINYTPNNDYYFSLSSDNIESYPQNALLSGITVDGKSEKYSIISNKSNNIDYDKIEFSGIKIECSHNDIKIYGTPTEDITITLPNATERQKISAPDKDFIVVENASRRDSSDGDIIIFDVENKIVQYSKKQNPESNDIKTRHCLRYEETISGLSPGTYYIRFATEEYYQKNSDWITFEIPVCEHQKFDNETNCCTSCGEKATVFVNSKDGTKKPYVELQDALKNIEDEDIIQVYSNNTIFTEQTESYTFPKGTYSIYIESPSVTLNVIDSQGTEQSFIVDEGSNITIKSEDSSDSGSLSCVDVKNGSLTLFNVCAKELTVENGEFNLLGGTIDKFKIKGKNIKLFDGTIKKFMWENDLDFNFVDFLASEKAYKNTSDEFIKLTDLNAETMLETTVTVCECPHGFNDSPNNCIYCNVEKSKAKSKINWFGDGTADTFTITTANQLKYFASLVNGEVSGKDAISFEGKTIVLGNDIDLEGNNLNEWKPIGNETNMFKGTFNGNGKKISGLYINSTKSELGLFGFVAAEGKIQNLEVSGTVKGNDLIGGLVGYNMGKISNCYNAGTVTGNDYVGGLVGANIGEISNCYNTGTVTGNDYVGGLIGYNNEKKISDCYNSGMIEGNNYVGGLIGINTGEISNCYNMGTVTGHFNEINAAAGIGGLIGANLGEISNCYNAGNVNGKTYVGGLVGTFQSGSASNCYNTGNVTGTMCVGGLIAYNYIKVSNCYNTGNVTGTNFVGGLLGHLTESGSASNCYSTGTVSRNSSEGDVGGFIGATIFDSTIITNCYYLKGCQGEGTEFNIFSGTEKSKEAFSSGEVAKALENGQDESESLQVWGQNLSTDEQPVLTSDGAIAVYQIDFVSKDNKTTTKYTNSGVFETIPTVSEHYCWLIDKKPESKFDKNTTVSRDITVYECVGEFVVDESELQNGKIKVFSPKNGTFTAIFAAYKDGKLVCFKTADVVVSEETGNVVNVSVPEGFVSTGADTVKVMLWNSFEEMKPLA